MRRQESKYLAWTSIKVPRVLANQIKSMARAEGIAPHKLIAKSVAAYKAHEKGFERRLWYAFKLMLVYGDFRALVKHDLADDKILKSLDYVLWQIQTRLKVINKDEKEAILKLAQEYATTRSNRTLYKLNDAIRDVIFKILAYM